MHGICKDYFDNSYKQMVNFFVENEKLSPKELKEIISIIEKGKNDPGHISNSHQIHFDDFSHDYFYKVFLEKLTFFHGIRYYFCPGILIAIRF